MGKRRAVGQIYERDRAKGKVWGVRFRLDGKRHYVTLARSWEGGTEESALRERDFLMEQVNRGLWTPDEKNLPRSTALEEVAPDFARFASEWFEDRRREGGRSGTGLSEKSEIDLRWRLESYLLPHFKGWAIDQIDVRAVDAFRRNLVAEGRLSPSSINKMISTLATILEIAVEYEILDRNPAAGSRRKLPEPKPRRTYLDRPSHIAALLAGAEALDVARGDRPGPRPVPYRRALVATLAFAGPRISEALDLRWKDVDLAAGKLRIRGRKTAAAHRVVDLLPALRDELAGLAAADSHRTPESRVFRTSKGGSLGATNVRKRILAPAVEEARKMTSEAEEEPFPEGITPHSLRRTFASILVALGRDPSYVMAQMGHTTPGFTLAVYAAAMAFGEGDRDRLRLLVEGRDLDPDDAGDRAPARGGNEAS
jgi:integrase